ncbi:MAG: VOC family protein [Chloroflexota bacterium]|nr:VOC family protein [Chloroflexota bacterium]MDE2945495.1 VOC family protein [Chloroflexota bacterium]
MPIGNKNQAIPGLGAHHIAIQTTDYEASVAFYTEVMGMTEVVGFENQGRRAVILDIGDGSHMELFEPIPGTQPSNDATGNVVFHFALQTTDIETALERVRAAGMEITVELTTVQMGPLNISLAFFKGPSGEVVEYIQVNS